MIRRISLDILNYLQNNILPPYKRQPIRIAFVGGLLQSVVNASIAYNAWRDDNIIRATVTGQTASLQWFLNYELDAIEQRILIIHGIIVGEPLSLRIESGAVFTNSLRSEGTTPNLLKLRGEDATSLPYDFRVIAPASVDQGQIKKIVDTYRQQGKLYDIQTF